MANIRGIKLRLRSVRKTQQITRAMKMVAGVKFRRAHAALLGSRVYARRLREITLAALGQQENAEERQPLLRRREQRRLLLVVISADRGLCGSFNSNVFRNVRAFIGESAPRGGAVQVGLLLIGRKGGDFFKRRQTTLANCSIQQYLPLAEADGAALGRQIGELYLAERYDRVEIFSTEFKSALHQLPTHAQLLPFEMPADAVPQARRANYIFEPDTAGVMAALLPRYIANRIGQALLESKTAEESVRMNMMDQATRNADEVIGQIMLDYNKARQMGITSELADITTGVEAMQ